MNNKSKTRSDRPGTSFNASKLYRWFKANKGQEKLPKEKPYLTEDQKKERKRWCECEKYRMELYGGEFYACFLDEKWFYTTSR